MQFPSTIPTLHTHELTLSPLSINDAEPLFKLVMKNRMYLRTWLNWVDQNTTIEQSTAFVERQLLACETHTGVTYTIWNNNTMIGVISYNWIDKINKKAQIGYWIDEEYQGKGHTTNACKELIKFGFTTLGLHRIEINVAKDNDKSSAIPKKLGFQMEAVLRDAEWLNDHFTDLEIYALLTNR